MDLRGRGVLGFGKVRTVDLDSFAETITTYDNARIRESSRQVDDFGNELSSAAWTTGGQRCETAATYDNLTASWLIGLVRTTQVSCNEHGMPLPEPRLSTMEYDGRGLVRKITIEPNHPELTELPLYGVACTTWTATMGRTMRGLRRVQNSRLSRRRCSPSLSPLACHRNSLLHRGNPPGGGETQPGAGAAGPAAPLWPREFWAAPVDVTPDKSDEAGTVARKGTRPEPGAEIIVDGRSDDERERDLMFDFWKGVVWGAAKHLLLSTPPVQMIKGVQRNIDVARMTAGHVADGDRGLAGYAILELPYAQARTAASIITVLPRTQGRCNSSKPQLIRLTSRMWVG